MSTSKENNSNGLKLVRFIPPDAENIRTGCLEQDEIIEMSGDIFSPGRRTGASFPRDLVRLLAPVNPSKIVCAGLNYRDHAEEVGMEIPEEPLLFFKPPTAVIGPGDPIILPPQSKQVDYEAEMAVVIGKEARKVGREQAFEYILGYTCLNDVTARDLQNKDDQWARAKGFDHFCPIGPFINTDIEPGNLSIEGWLNGERKQSSSTSNLIFDVGELVEYISHIMTLVRGDVIATGTPAGIDQLNDGDVFEVKVEGLGVLANPAQKE